MCLKLKYGSVVINIAPVGIITKAGPGNELLWFIIYQEELQFRNNSNFREEHGGIVVQESVVFSKSSANCHTVSYGVFVNREQGFSTVLIKQRNQLDGSDDTTSCEQQQQPNNFIAGEINTNPKITLTLCKTVILFQLLLVFSNVIIN